MLTGFGDLVFRNWGLGIGSSGLGFRTPQVALGSSDKEAPTEESIRKKASDVEYSVWPGWCRI